MTKSQKFTQNRDFQIWDYGANFLDLVRHLYFKILLIFAKNDTKNSKISKDHA